MAHHNSSTMTAIVSDISQPIGQRLRTILQENRWTVDALEPDAVELEPVDVLIVLDLHGKGAAQKRQVRIETLIGAAQSAGVPRVVLLSDVSVYTDQVCAIGQVRETSTVRLDTTGTPVGIRATLASEQTVMNAPGIESVVLRIPTLLYDKTDDRALAEMREWMISGHVDTGGLAFQRLHPDDLAQAVQSASRRAEAVGQVFNIVEPMAVSPDVLSNELARLGRLLTDPDATDDRVRPAYQLALPVYASDKASRLLEFRPRRTLWVGLAECAQAIVAGMRDQGQLPLNKPKLPPLIEVLETRSAKLQGQTCVIAGATSGIGRELAVLLSRCGAKVVAVGPDAESGAKLIAELENRPSCTDGVYYQADLTQIAEIRRIAGTIRSHLSRIDALINCMSAAYNDRSETADGYESSFAVNYLAAFQFTTALMDMVPAEGHIITLGSEMHNGSGVDFADLFCQRAYQGADAYGRARFANVMFARSLADKMGRDGPRVVTVNPGLDPDMKKPAEGGRWQQGIMPDRNATTEISPWMAATRVAGVLVDPKLRSLTGVYIDEDKQGQSDPRAADPAARAHLWRVSEALVDMA